jgi:hypothetical protein
MLLVYDRAFLESAAHHLDRMVMVGASGFSNRPGRDARSPVKLYVAPKPTLTVRADVWIAFARTPEPRHYELPRRRLDEFESVAKSFLPNHFCPTLSSLPAASQLR